MTLMEGIGMLMVESAIVGQKVADEGLLIKMNKGDA